MRPKYVLRTLYRTYLKPRNVATPRNLLLWYGSFGFKGAATLGDLLAVDNISEQLTRGGFEHAIVTRHELEIERHFQVADVFSLAGPFDTVAFVCGPLSDYANLQDFFAINAIRRSVAVGVSVIPRHGDTIALFDHIVARDGLEPSNSYFDLAVSTVEPPKELVSKPLKIGICLRGQQSEYGRSGQSQAEVADRLLIDLAAGSGAVTHQIDTVIRSDNRPEAIAKAFSDADVIFTTRMHGGLLSLAAGRPVIAIDQIAGSAKVSAVLRKAEWPYVFNIENLTADVLQSALRQILTIDIRPQVQNSQRKILSLVQEATAKAVHAITGHDM